MRISKGGQISIPAEVRRRWATRAVVLEDLGDRLVIQPTADDPIAAARGALKGEGLSSEEHRRRSRLEEDEIEDQKWRRFSTRSR